MFSTWRTISTDRWDSDSKRTLFLATAIGAFANCFKARLDLLNAADERPYPLDLIIFNVVDGWTREQTSYLLVQSDSVIIKQQHLPGEHLSAQKQVIDRIAIQWMQLVSEQTWDEVGVMRVLESPTADIIIHLPGSENCGSFRIEWLIAGCWRSRHDTMVEHGDSRRTDMLRAYVVLLLWGRNYRLRIEWTKSP
jgi:hypothetical protein